MRRVPQRHQYRFRQPEFRQCKWSLKSLPVASVRRLTQNVRKCSHGFTHYQRRHRQQEDTNRRDHRSPKTPRCSGRYRNLVLLLSCATRPDC